MNGEDIFLLVLSITLLVLLIPLYVYLATIIGWQLVVLVVVFVVAMAVIKEGTR